MLWNSLLHPLCFLTGLLIALLLTPVMIRCAKRFGFMDCPGGRKIHQRPMPLLGGVAVFAGMWVPLAFLAVFTKLDELRGARAAMLWVMFAAGAAMLLTGLLDDKRGLRAGTKFYIQLALAGALAAAGVRFESVTIPGLGSVTLGAWSIPLTILWLVGVTNAFNLIDGIDGLGAGVALFTAVTGAIVSLGSGRPFLAVILLCLGGACLGFLRYNFHPAKIFLGDAGSLFIGATLAVAGVITAGKGTMAASMLIPLVALGYPVMDTLLAVLRRTMEDRSIFSSDQRHIHHVLLAKGLGHKNTALVLYGFCLLMCLGALAIISERDGLIAGFLCAVLAATFVLARYIGKSGLLEMLGLGKEARSGLRPSVETGVLKESVQQPQKAVVPVPVPVTVPAVAGPVGFDDDPDAGAVCEYLKSACRELRVQWLSVFITPPNGGVKISDSWEIGPSIENNDELGEAFPPEVSLAFQDTGLIVTVRRPSGDDQADGYLNWWRQFREVADEANGRLRAPVGKARGNSSKALIGSAVSLGGN